MNLVMRSVRSMRSTSVLAHNLVYNHLKFAETQYLTNRAFGVGPSKPNPKSLILLQNLPISVTNSLLSETVASIETIRKAEVEPGCALHIIDEIKAEHAAKQIRSLKLKANVKTTCLPAVALQNLPNNITAESLFKSFEEFHPLAVRFSGKRQITVTVGDVDSAIQVENLVKNIEGSSFQQYLTKSPDGRFCVHISNFPSSLELKDALQMISTAVCSQIPKAALSMSPGNSRVTVRLAPQKQYYLDETKSKLETILEKIEFTNRPITAEVKQIKKPALFLHGVLGMQEEILRQICQEENEAERLQMTWKSRDITGDLAVAYFKNETDAYKAMKIIKTTKIGDKRIKPAFQMVSEPGVKITGFPESLTKSKFFQLFSSFKIASIDVLPLSMDPNGTAYVVLSNKKEVDQFITYINAQNPGGYNMTAVDYPIDDWCFEFTFPEHINPPVNEITKAFENENISIKSISVDSNISAYVAFPTTEHATRSQSAIVAGNLTLSHEAESSVPTAYDGEGVISSSVSIFPSYAIEVVGVPQDQSAQYVIDSLQDVDVFKSERSASVKFKKHQNVVPGMKALRRLEIEGTKLKPIRNHPMEEEGDPDYDSRGSLDTFDREQYNTMLKDYLSAEPAVRYQMARNFFERALYSAEGTTNIAFLVDSNSPNVLKMETRQLLTTRTAMINHREASLKEDKPLPDDFEMKFDQNTARLFEIFIQKEDMVKFSYDFADMEAILGPANNTEGNISEWNNILLDKRALYQDMGDILRSFNPNKKQDIITDENNNLVVVDDVESGNNDKTENDQEVNGRSVSGPRGVFSDDEFLNNLEEKDSYANVEVADHDGHRWSVIILHEDQTQVVTASGRVMSYRILITIGNLRGAGGFGMGKGDTPTKAIIQAFREALRNLIFIDLYENCALAHDLVGRENNCWVYIRATPKDRLMVASPLARMIFNSFGIISCSCKIVGRRHPYAMIRAIYKALLKHRNLDEIAKDRGARYLTLKWMYDHGL